MSNYKNLLYAVLFVLSASIVMPVSAQSNSDDEQDSDVEEIVVKGKVLYSDQVNALKTPVRILDVPQTLSIVTDVDIKKQGFRELGDIVRYTPGVNTSQGEGHRDSIDLEAFDQQLTFTSMV